MPKVEMIEHEPEVIEVAKSKLDQIIERQDKLEEENREKDKELELLRKSVSSAKYNFEKEKMDKDRIPTVRFKLWKGVPILAYKAIDQSLIRSPATGMIVSESIRYNYKLADGTEIEIPYHDFYTIIEHAVAHVIDKRTDHAVTMYDGKIHDHELIFTCEFLDPELNAKYGKVEQAVTYVNM